MGREGMGKRDVIDKIHNELHKHLDKLPSIGTKNGKQRIKIHVKPTAPLSKLLEVIKHAHDYAEGASKSTHIHVATNTGEKIFRFEIPVATKGKKNGEPIFPYFKPAGGKALHIGPNTREIVGQYIAAHIAAGDCPDVENMHVYSNVGIQVSRKQENYTVYTSDIDLLHIMKYESNGKTVFKVAPVEVMTRLDRLDYKIKGWEHLVSALESFGKNEGVEIKVEPIFVHVATDIVRGENVDIEGRIRKKFPNCKVVRIKSRTWTKNGNSKDESEKWHVEYIGESLKNIAKLPKKYHSELASAVVSNYSDLERLEELFGEMAALRKIWKAEKIPENAKRLLVEKYIDIVSVESERPLLKAFHEIKQHMGGNGGILGRLISKAYKK